MKSICYIDNTPLMKAGLTPSQCKMISNTVRKWIRCCGPEWTVARLKSLKMFYLYSCIGREYPLEWIALRDSIPKGPFRVLFRGTKSWKRVKKVFNALMIYTGIRLSENQPSRQQKEKFFTSLDAEDIPINSPIHFKSVMDEIRSFSREVEFRRYTYHEVPMNGKKSSCDVLGRSAPNCPERLADDFRTTVIWDLLDDDDIADVIAETFGSVFRFLFQKVTEDSEVENIGRISVIQEKGCKARFIAIPRMVPQVGLLSLGRYLLKVLDKLPWDCTHNQTIGPDWALTQLRSGKRLWSVDLADFTNHWPLCFIEACLEDLRLIPYGDLRLFHETAKRPYLFGNELKRWTRGQPLGTYASFPAAALSHGVLLRCCERAIGVRDTFRVLGDDVLISNGEVCDLYMAYLRSWKIPVSDAKSLYDAKFGEFAGRLISDEGVFQPRKFLIPNSGNLLTYIDSKVPDIHAATTELEFVAKLESIFGNNPSGLSLDQRANLYYLVHDHVDDAKSYLVSREHTSIMPRLRFYLDDYTDKIVLSRHYVEYWLRRALSSRRPYGPGDVHSAIKPVLDFLSQRPAVFDARLLSQCGVLEKMYAHWYHPRVTSDQLSSNHRRLLGYISLADHFLDSVKRSDIPWWSRILAVQRRELELARCHVDEAKRRIQEIRCTFLESL